MLSQLGWNTSVPFGEATEFMPSCTEADWAYIDKPIPAYAVVVARNAHRHPAIHLLMFFIFLMCFMSFN